MDTNPDCNVFRNPAYNVFRNTIRRSPRKVISEREGSDHHQSESKPKQELTSKAQFIIAKSKQRERERKIMIKT